MEELVQRFFGNLLGRLDGPLHLRFFIQPLMATLFAVIDGIADARQGKPPYFWALFTYKDQRKALLKDGWKHFGKIFIIAILLDILYQAKVLHALYPGELLLTAFVLAVLPYMLLRGPVNRVVRFFRKVK